MFVFKNKLKYSKRFDQVTDDVIEKIYQVEHYFPPNMFFACDKRFTLYSPRPSLPNISLMVIIPLKKCRTSTGYF